MIQALWLLIGPLLIKGLTILGIGFVSYTGGEAFVSAADNFLLSSFTGMPANMLAIAQKAGFQDGLQIIISAYTAYMSIKLVTGSLTKVKIL